MNTTIGNRLEAAITIEGTRPLLWHAFTPDAIPSSGKREARSGRAGNDPEEWRRSVLITATRQLYLLPSYIFGCLRDAARFTRKGRGTLQPALVATLQVIDERILVNPCKGVEVPEADHEEITPLTPANVAALLDVVNHYDVSKATGATQPHRLAALYHVAIRCGPRQGEIIGLRKADYDAKRRELRIGGQIQDGKRTKGKTKHAHRTLPVSADTARTLAAHLQNLAEEERLSGPGWNAAGLLFVSENGTPLGHSNLWRSYTALLRRAGLTDPMRRLCRCWTH